MAMHHHEICREISGELEDAARGLAGGVLSPGQFRILVETLEMKKLTRFGFKLSSRASEDGLVHFSLRFADSGDLCSSMEVNPETGKLFTQHAC